MTQNTDDGLNNEFNYHYILVAEIIILDLVNNNFDYPVSNLCILSPKSVLSLAIIYSKMMLASVVAFA